jgi:outer membrane autotransporter protein
MASYAADKAVPVAPTGALPGWNIGLWGQGFGAFGNVRGDGNAASFDRETGGFVLGADAAFGDGWRAGIAGAFTSTSFEISDRLSAGSLDSWHLSAYGSKNFGALNVRGGAILSHNDADVNRTVSFRSFGGSNASGYSGNSMNLFGEVGYNLTFGAVGLEPFVGLNHARFDSDGFTEEGTAGSALQSAGTSFEQTYSHVGLRLAGNLPVGSGSLVANAGIAWRHAFGETTPGATLLFASGGLPFTVAGVPVDRDSVVVETGLNWLVSPTASLGVKYDGSFGERAREHALKGNFEVRF